MICTLTCIHGVNKKLHHVLHHNVDILKCVLLLKIMQKFFKIIRNEYKRYITRTWLCFKPDFPLSWRVLYIID